MRELCFDEWDTQSDSFYHAYDDGQIVVSERGNLSISLSRSLDSHWNRCSPLFQRWGSPLISPLWFQRSPPPLLYYLRVASQSYWAEFCQHKPVISKVIRFQEIQTPLYNLAWEAKSSRFSTGSSLNQLKLLFGEARPSYQGHRLPKKFEWLKRDLQGRLARPIHSPNASLPVSCPRCWLDLLYKVI